VTLSWEDKVIASLFRSEDLGPIYIGRTQSAEEVRVGVKKKHKVN
jgi:hypothetical protein